jgi:MFS family permease
VLWVVFLQQQYGFTLTQVTLLDLPFWIGKFIFEIPTGVVADRYGRRLSLAISAGLSSLTWLVFSLSGSFWVLAAAQFAGAFGATFSSGADEALLYETIKALGREQEYA